MHDWAHFWLGPAPPVLRGGRRIAHSGGETSKGEGLVSSFPVLLFCVEDVGAFYFVRESVFEQSVLTLQLIPNWRKKATQKVIGFHTDTQRQYIRRSTWDRSEPLQYLKNRDTALSHLVHGLQRDP